MPIGVNGALLVVVSETPEKLAVAVGLVSDAGNSAVFFSLLPEIDESTRVSLPGSFKLFIQCKLRA